ncbi:acyltransferase family protein [Erythrobacter sp. F6033]|uniref:acyltransferase family protein n=1 Tax=Erythrobacter sp. F6033 TaxID=2926401 RepID=UPI001FF17BD5|nr:acyltransferase family protein [Erythrobacter sp. F6033]MCK0129158.1 acyltransferase family protein [Erythrobacter sp. F6033]
MPRKSASSSHPFIWIDMSNSMQAPPARKHYHDIDGARSVLMFLSVALHAGTVYAPARPWITGNTDRADFFDWLIFGFHLFVTPTFFFVGGFFAVLLLTRRAAGDFISNRLLRTAVPLVAIALTFNMIEHYLRWTDSGGQGSMLDWIGSPAFVAIWADGTWQLHLWFLVSLLPMFLLAVVVHSLLPKESRLRSLAVAFSDKLAGWISGSAAFAVALLVFALANTANYSAAALVPGSYDLIFPGFQSWYKLVSEFPFFVIGVMAALSPRLLSALFEWRWWMPYAAAAALFFQPYPDAAQSFEVSITMLFLNQLAIWTIVLFILQFFHRFFSEGGPRTQWLADCALSMYLFHHCFVYIYGQMLTEVEWPIAVEFSVLTIAAAGTVIAIHEGLVRRFAIIRLLFNGKTDIAAVKKQPGLIAAFSASAQPVKSPAQSGATGSGASLSPR